MFMEALRQNRSRARVSKSAFIPAPTGGWDDSQNIAATENLKAHVLDNWFPEPETVNLRGGFKQHCNIGEGTLVQSLMEYHGPSGTNKMFAAINGKIFDATDSAGVSAVTGLSNNKWQHINFTTSGGNFLVCVNGEDAPRNYNGSSWSVPTITGTGITPSDFIHVNAHKGRVFFIPVNSTYFVYLPVDSIAGAGSKFELGGVMTKGGYLVASGTLTMDGGSGPDDHAVFVTSKGQAIVYQGTNPADANAWSLVGVYEIPEPLGYRCLHKIAGDLGILTVSGVLPLSKAMVVDRAAVANVAISTNINTTFTQSATKYGANWGWQILTFPNKNMFVVNVPLTENTTSHQYVMNTRSGAWCRYTGINSLCWCFFNGKLYFGGKDGKVYQSESAADDNGSPIIADMVTAYSFFGSIDSNKQFKMVRPHIFSDGRVGSAIKMLVDWGSHTGSTAPTNFVGVSDFGADTWNDGSLWNDGSTWAQTRRVTRDWRSVSGVGRSSAIWMRVNATSTITTPITMNVSGFDVIYESGGMI